MLIVAAPTAFWVLKIAGALYLLWLAYQAIVHGGGLRLAARATRVPTLRESFATGVGINLLNPKVVLFFFSFLPQFIIAAHGNVALQTLQLGLTFTVQAALLFGALGYFSGSIGQWLKRRPRAGLWLDRIAGAVFVSLGIKLIAGR